MFADYFQIKLGETVVKGRRLSIKETRQLLDDFDTDKLTIEAALKVIKDRCTLANGGKFDPEEISPVEALKNTTLPVIFFHGESDDFVPCQMSRINYEACASRKKLVIIPGAGHGLSFPADQERYVAELREFFGPEASAD